jgi:hypothetical protein
MMSSVVTPATESLAQQTVTKRQLAKWMLLTPIALSGVIALIVTLSITAWFTERRFAGMPHHHGSLPAQVRDIIIPLSTIIGEWFTVWLWWSFFRKTDSFSSLFQTRTKTPWMEFGIGVLACGLLVFLLDSCGCQFRIGPHSSSS